MVLFFVKTLNHGPRCLFAFQTTEDWMNEKDIFVKLLEHYEANDWCRGRGPDPLIYPRLKQDIDVIGVKRVITGLGLLSWDQFDRYFSSVTAVFKLLFSERLVQSDQDFKSIEGSPAWRYFFGFTRQRHQSGSHVIDHTSNISWRDRHEG